MRNKELNWKKLKSWLEERSFNLDLSINPERFKKGMGNLNYKVLINGKICIASPIPPPELYKRTRLIILKFL